MPNPATVAELLPRAQVSIESVHDQVASIISEVKTDSLAALSKQAKQFDGLDNVSFRVPRQLLKNSLEQMNPKLTKAIETSISRVRQVSEATLPATIEIRLGDGAVVRQRPVPVDSVGLYVPGGKAVYPSSVIMNVVPAQVAKVPRIAVTSPAQKDGIPSPSVLATCELLGIDEVYAIGGASAVAAFAFGIPEIELEPVRLVTGPGNIFVAAAKRQLRGVIGIDSEAGPTEIMILADSSANPAFIAADLISQAEHDPNAAAVLVTTSDDLIHKVQLELEKQVPLARNSERIREAFSGIQSALVLVPNMDVAVEIANEYATEHLEIHASNAETIAEQITNAGAVFIGEYSPVSLGDYLAGSNHVLPTGTQAKFSSGLGVHSFLRYQQQISYSSNALAESIEDLVNFSQAESLDAHGSAGAIRFEEN